MSETEAQGPTPSGTRDPASAAKGLRGALVRALFGTTAGLLATVVWSALALRAGYAGAYDDAAATQAAQRYSFFLGAVARSLVLVALGKIVCLLPLTLGLILLSEELPRRPRFRGERWVIAFLAGLVVVYSYFAFVAHRYPGLFLSTLAGTRILTVSALYGHWLTTLVVLASVAGFLSVFRPGRSLGTRIGASIVAVLFILGVALWKVPKGRPAVFGADEIKPLKTKSDGAANVLFLAIDSLRPDHVDPVQTPNIARLISESVYFPNTLVTLPRTGPSWAATLTSMPPLKNGIETMFPNKAQGALSTFSMPAHLASFGYRTGAISEYAGEFFRRVDFGFQVDAVPTVELKEITGQMLLALVPTLLDAVGEVYTQGARGRAILGKRLTNLVRGMANFSHPRVLASDLGGLIDADANKKKEKGQPRFFGLVFYSQPHFPYTSSSAFYPKYRVSNSSPTLAFGRDATNETPITTDVDKKQLDGLYRAALAETDAAIGDLLDVLESHHVLRRTIIVLMADHGEGLYDCSTCVGHGDNLRGTVTIKVPLAFHLPKMVFSDFEPSRQEAYASQLDVYPTILSLLGKKPIAVHEGIALLDKQGRPNPVPERTHFVETGEWLWPTPAVPKVRIAYPPITQTAALEGDRIVIDDKWNPEIRAAKFRAAVRPPWFLMYEPGPVTAEYRLYNMDRDPFQDRDVSGAEPQVFDELKTELRNSMLRSSQIIGIGDYFLTRPQLPPDEKW